MSSVDATRAIGRRSGVVVRKDVRRDSDGFEDIDDFWDDDDSSAANDSTTDIQRPGDAFEFTGRAGKSPATKSVLRTPKKASDPGPNVHRNSDGFDDIDEFWVQAGASANRVATSQPVPASRTAITPPFARRSKFPSSTLVDRQEFEFGMASPHDDDPFEGNLTPIAHAEDHTLYTPPSSPTKQRLQKPKQTKTLKSVGKKAKPRSNRRRKVSADAGSDVESSFALTDQSRMDSESEHSDVDVTVLSNADAIHRDSDSEGDGRGVRRSKRRRIKPLEWYKCERPVYERRQSGVGLILPTISHVERAGTKTPVKLKPHKSSYQSKTTPFPTADLPSEFSYLATDTGDIWDELHDDATKMRVIGRSKSSQVFALPGVQGFPCGYAGQTFNLPGGPTLPTWISGRLLLPPSGVKQPESVGNCTQSFVVLQCQPGALEVAYAHPSEGEYNDETAQRFLLSQGDEYFVPPNNAYYLRNHSKSVEAELRFTIMKPSRLQVAEAGATSGNKKTKKAKIN
ncbi:hypothetical protein DYB26_000153 [Aphanomyces astaci]|uniref:Mif2/CENP-C cupin domain-containing protein n=1 Tax=Aphanomyces astaci TaxID=112090 RepID=A0A418CJ79_APHAT|nr:hypothetical protein DYB26_000153 [Aphanomyces astaci]